MNRRRTLAAAVALLCAAVAAGCGVGPGDSAGEVTLRVTRDYGSREVVPNSHPEVRESDTILRLLSGEADTTTRYGGKFVQSVEGVEGGEEDGRRVDWFFYVNGVESPVGSADIVPREDQDVWWDFRDWTDAMRVPAVVGAFPEPFLHGYENHAPQTRIDCLGERAPCDAVQKSLSDAGVEAGVADAVPGSKSSGGNVMRILVGPWAAVGEDPAAAQIDEGPAYSGVFARFEGEGAQAKLVGLDTSGDVRAGPLGPRAGLVAGVRYQDDPPTWVVTAAGKAGVAAAASLLTPESLGSHYAVLASPDGVALPVPVTG